MSDPENIVLKLLREMRGEMTDMRGEIGDVREQMATNMQVANVRAEIAASENRVSERITHLNRAVVEYHSSVVGHGLLITDIDERLRRVEEHLNLKPVDQH